MNLDKWLLRSVAKAFDILWEKAIPVKERIIETEAIEKGTGNAARITNEEKDTPSIMFSPKVWSIDAICINCNGSIRCIQSVCI